MSKTVGKILQVAALVAAIALIPVSGGTSTLLLGSVSATTSAIIMAGLTVASFANALLMPKAKQQARQAAVVSLSIGEASREAIFGTALVGGSLVDAFNWGGKYGTDWECQIICLADHRVSALQSFYVNDTLIPYTGDGPLSHFNNHLEVYFRDGSPGQTVPDVVLTNGPGWTADDVGTGLAWVAVCYKADPENAKNFVWPAGRPSFSWVIDGALCYQARKDTSVGGSGDHRRDDPSTWEWSDNPIDTRYSWVRGIYALDQVDDPSMLLIGRGLSEVEAPPQNVFPRANVCDELVERDAGGYEKRYRANGVISADETFATVEEWFASACAGIIIQPEGSVEIEPGQAKSPVFFFSDDDLIVGSKVSFSTFQSESSDEWVNTVVPRYVEPEQKYSEHAAPLRRVFDTIVADGGPREETLSLPLVTSWTQAGRCGEIKRRLGRLPKRCQLTLGPRFVEVEEGDWGVWTSQRYLGGASVMFRVDAYSCGENWHMTLNLRQMEAIVYARDSDTGSGAVAIGQDPPPPLAAPDEADWTLSAIAVDGLPALQVLGGVIDDYLQRIEFQYWKSDGSTDPEDATDWIDAGSASPDAKERIISGVLGSSNYYVSIRYVIGGRQTDPLILGPATTPASVLLDLGDLAANFNDRNDRIATTPPSPGIPGSGAAVDHTINADGSIDMSFEWTFAGVEAENDGFEVLLYSSTSAAAYTIGSDPANERVLSIPIDKRAFIERGIPADRRYTWAIRTYRVVDPDIDIDQVKHSAWIKSGVSGENPYHPPTQNAASGDITTTIDGKPAATVADAVTNFNSRNDRISATPAAPTMLGGGAAVDHVQNDDGSVDVSFEWLFAGVEADNDGFEIEVWSSASSSAYTPGSNALSLVTRVPINRRAFILQGVPANVWYTFAVRTWRGVDPDITASGVLTSAWVKSTVSGENPYRPNANPAFAGDISGTVAGLPATTVAATINSDGTIATAMVVANSIEDGAINTAGYTQSTTAIFMPASTTVNYPMEYGQTVAGGEINLRAILPIYLTVTNPVQGQVYSARLCLSLRGPSGVWSYPGDYLYSERWDAPSASGSFNLQLNNFIMEKRFSGVTNGSWEFGWRIITPATNGVAVPSSTGPSGESYSPGLAHYLKSDCPVAAQ
jgi:hypothetical protein